MNIDDAALAESLRRRTHSREDTGSLSFGYQTVALAGPTSFNKTVSVHNYSDHKRTYAITPLQYQAAAFA